ncbi:unnamed protein product [Notodromas monacha]|uniref:Uncharacterized protein n=1 Tax=Notodromas monacha TaxID=399045 RepID=A0A7R9BFI9_9CRUS|nr:unnamed protein product [Notodromas monacha]CAG0913175.1 unnamed protein product [Notodromas monacha]
MSSRPPFWRVPRARRDDDQNIRESIPCRDMELSSQSKGTNVRPASGSYFLCPFSTSCVRRNSLISLIASPSLRAIYGMSRSPVLMMRRHSVLGGKEGKRVPGHAGPMRDIASATSFLPVSYPAAPQDAAKRVRR